MFKNIQNWSQKQLKWANIGFNTLYILLTFIAPIITVITMTGTTGQIQTKYKIPLIIVVICIAIILAAAKFLKKSIDKIQILEIDGTYNRSAQIIKHILQFVSQSILPIILLAATICFNTFLKNWLEFYSTMIIACLSFFLAGHLLESLVIAELDEENDIRGKVAESNAVNNRRDLR